MDSEMEIDITVEPMECSPLPGSPATVILVTVVTVAMMGCQVAVSYLVTQMMIQYLSHIVKWQAEFCPFGPSCPSLMVMQQLGLLR